MLFKQPVFILSFHRISAATYFERIIEFLSNNFSIVDISQINDFVNGQLKLANACCITFDDGEYSFYEKAFPILRRYNIPATLFLSPRVFESRFRYWFQILSSCEKDMFLKFLAKNVLYCDYEAIRSFNPFSILKTFRINEMYQILKSYSDVSDLDFLFGKNIGVNEFNELAKSGLISFGTHTLNHPILKNEADDVKRTEISKSIELLERMHSGSGMYFSYPNGRPDLDFDENDIDILKEQDVALAVTNFPGLLTKNTNRYLVPRISMTDTNLFKDILKIKLLKNGIVRSGKGYLTEIRERKSILKYKIIITDQK